MTNTATETENGIVCSCGSTGWDVLHTEKKRGHILRRRECRVCGQRTTTIEKRVGDAPPSLTATCSELLQISMGQIQKSLELLGGRSGESAGEPKDSRHELQPLHRR